MGMILPMKSLLSFPFNQNIDIYKNFLNALTKFKTIKTQKEKCMYHTPSELCYDLFQIFNNQYADFSDAKKKTLAPNSVLPIYILHHKAIRKDGFKKKKSTDTHLMPSLQGDKLK